MVQGPLLTEGSRTSSLLLLIRQSRGIYRYGAYKYIDMCFSLSLQPAEICFQSKPPASWKPCLLLAHFHLLSTCQNPFRPTHACTDTHIHTHTCTHTHRHTFFLSLPFLPCGFSVLLPLTQSQIKHFLSVPSSPLPPIPASSITLWRCFCARHSSQSQGVQEGGRS